MARQAAVRITSSDSSSKASANPCRQTKEYAGRIGPTGMDLPTLVSLSKQGDDRAFEVIFRTYRTPLLSFIRSRSAPDSDHEQLLLDTFSKAHRKLGQLRENRKFLVWLYRIACNVVRQDWRSRSRLHEEPSSDDQPTAGGSDPFQRLYHKEKLRRIRLSLSTLPPLKRELMRYALLGLPDRKIAVHLGLTQASVKCHKYRVRRWLAKILND